MIRRVLGGIAAGVELDVLVQDLEPLRRRNSIFPGELLLELAADALEESGARRMRPIQYVGIRERFLPECQFRGNTEHQKSHYALRAAAMIYAGVHPDVVEDVGWWRVNDLWVFALYALVIYVRAAADHGGATVADVCERIAARHGVQLAAAPR